LRANEESVIGAMSAFGLSRHDDLRRTRLLSGVKRTSLFATHISAFAIQQFIKKEAAH
jgi:hypothetical protein